MKGWHAAFPALLLLIPTSAGAAEDLTAAARELARKTGALAGHETVSIAWRNLSSLGTQELGEARAVFEAALRETGARPGETVPAAEARITLSENAAEYLLVEEIRKGEDRQVWMASWKRTLRAAAPSTGVALEKRLIWEQDEQILDVAFSGNTLLMLSAARVSTMVKQNGQWSATGSAALPARSWPRDLRGRLRLTGAGYQAMLPGTVCRGGLQPLTLECQPSAEPWLLESGTRAMLLAAFTANRNYFDGKITTQTGVRKSVAPFFSAAAFEEQGQTYWLLALLDGRTQLFDPSFEPAAVIANWGSDIAGTDAPCAGGTQVLATRPGDGAEADTVQAFGIVNRSPAALSAPVSFTGPVTALWPSGGTSAVAVARDPATGKYAAYTLTVVCGL